MLRIEELLGMRPIHELKLIVEESTSTSFTEAYLSQNMMTEHVVWYGDSKVLLGNDGLKTACTLLTDSSSEAVADDKIKLNSIIRGKLGVFVGDSITIMKYECIPQVRIVSFAPFKECAKDLESVNLFEAYLRPYFKDAFRPVHKGDVFKISLHRKDIQFKITNIDPSPFGIVGPGTIIDCQKGVQLIQKTKILKSTKGLSTSVSVTVPGPIIMDVPNAALLARELMDGPVTTDRLNTEQNKGPTKFQLTKAQTHNLIPKALPGCSQGSNSTKVPVGDSRNKSKTFFQEFQPNIEVFSSPVQQQIIRKPVQHVSPMVDQRTATQCDRSRDTKNGTQSQTSVVPIVPRKEPQPDLDSVSVRILRTRAIMDAAKEETKSCNSKRKRQHVNNSNSGK